MKESIESNLLSEMDITDELTKLALDLSWSWNHSADEVWKQLDPELWELTGNPWLILQLMSPRKIEAAIDATSRRRVHELLTELTEKNAAPAWFQTAHPSSSLHTVAYFSMEYMLSEALPIYSGGLGNVAGDQLKAASDLGVPVVAIGLLYQQGYFRQELDTRGEQHVLYPVNEPAQLPIRPVRTADGELLRMSLRLPGGKVWIRTWEVQVGRTRLYLLDANDPANPPNIRAITSELYGGGSQLRLEQELLLGIVGWRFLRELGVPADVCHLNEGHVRYVRSRIAEVRRVGGIECLRAEFQLASFPNRESPENTKIQVEGPGAPEGIETCCAESDFSYRVERERIKPRLSRARLARVLHVLHHLIGPLRRSGRVQRGIRRDN